MSGYKYDDEGGQFFTFALTGVVAFIVPYTYRTLFSRKKITAQGWLDRPGNKTRTAQSLMAASWTGVLIRMLVLVAGWASVAYLVRGIATAAQNSTHAIYDPFQILGIAASATEKEIRRRYRKLSIQFHPDKLRNVENQTKEEIDSYYIELTKAYKSLTDETTRKNLELYGHPDGRQEMSLGIALPTWIVDSRNNVWVLGAYGLVLAVGLPLLVARWWYGTRSRTKDGVLSVTALNFFTKLKKNMSQFEVFQLLGNTEELQQFASQLTPQDQSAYEALEADTLKTFKRIHGVDLLPKMAIAQDARRASVLLAAFLHRIDSSNKHVEQVKYNIGLYTDKLLSSLLAISTAHNRLEQTTMIRDMIPCVAQAVPVQGGSLAEIWQLPHITLPLAELLMQKESVKSKGLQGLWKVPDAERRSLLVADDKMTNAAYQEMIQALGEWPRIELVDAYFTVMGEEQVTAGALMQLVAKVRLLPLKRDGSLLRDGRRLDAKDKAKSSHVRPGTEEFAQDPMQDPHDGKRPMGVAYVPHLAEERKPHWFVQMGDHKNDLLIIAPTKFSDIDTTEVRTVRINVQAPTDPGLYTFMLNIASDSYLGSSASQLLKLRVEEAPDAQDEDDYISDPEEDTIAGQMALMRGERVKPAAALADDDDDEEDDDDDDDEDDDDDDDDESSDDSDSSSD
ncbi:secretory subunit [Malassezia psittaci]|uniref:Secretory subunit n=1 Tax=Malassezia psittaci TaxID=1821823 RepID=A0AAF0FAW4_9BASI|nr:secretory subunit [Malassezia psittaci]